MKKYNPKDWFGLIFEFHKSDTLRRLLYILLIYGAYAGLIVYLELHYTNFKSTISIHSLLGFVIGYNEAITNSFAKILGYNYYELKT